MNKIAILVGVVGAVVLIVSAVLGFRVLPDLIKRRTEEEVSLRPLSDTWNSWSEITRPLYMNVYILNITNKDTIAQDGYPKFAEVGPYAYSQRRRKINLNQHDGERLVSYEQETYYIFDKDASAQGLEESDPINILNLPFYMLLFSVGRMMPGAEPLVGNLLLPNETIIRTVTVGELLFQGMDISAINTAIETLATLNPEGNITIPDAFQGGRFGLYRGNNGSTDGVYRIHTGVGDSGLFGEILDYNGDSRLGFWNHLSECDKVKGSDGSIFPPFVEKSHTINIFSSDICRSLSLSHVGEEQVKGIEGYKFTVSKKVFEDPRINPANRCFCHAANVEDCLHAGVIDVSRCRSGVPFVMSLPHFLDGNDTYADLAGLQPNRALHETALILEPNSGALLKANKRIQLNMDYKSVENVFAMNGTESLIFPVLWIEEAVVFTDSNVKDLNSKLLNPKKAVFTWRWVGVGIGIFGILAGMGIYVWKG